LITQYLIMKQTEIEGIPDGNLWVKSQWMATQF
jgi:hypothetical protein